MSLISLTGSRRPLSRCPRKGIANCPINIKVSIKCPTAARFQVFVFAEDVSCKASTCNSRCSMQSSNSNACTNMFSLTSKEYVIRESMLILDLDDKRL